jgi:hypothetical protein
MRLIEESGTDDDRSEVIQFRVHRQVLADPEYDSGTFQHCGFRFSVKIASSYLRRRISR